MQGYRHKPFHLIFKILNLVFPGFETFFSRDSFLVKFANVVWNVAEDINNILNQLWSYFSGPKWALILIQSSNVRSHN